MNEPLNHMDGLTYIKLKNIISKPDVKEYVLCNSMHMKAN